jgi:TonB family protein
MRRRNQNHDLDQNGTATSLNLLDLSEPQARQNYGLYWTILISMILAYGTYMTMIANMEQPSGAEAEYIQSADASFASRNDTEALAKADRETIEINIPKHSEDVAKDVSEPLINMPDRLPRQDGGSVASDDLAENAVTIKTPAREEPPILVHAMANTSKASPAARAILRRINEAAHGKPRPVPKDETDRGRTQLAESIVRPPPLPIRRPYTALDIASHELSSQHGSEQPSMTRKASKMPANIRTYRKGVRAHLAANRPSGGFGSGRVAISFRLSVDGKIRSAEVLQAPEEVDLHERALTALYRAVPFPAAPDNAPDKYRAFSVSFIFE